MVATPFMQATTGVYFEAPATSSETSRSIYDAPFSHMFAFFLLVLQRSQLICEIVALVDPVRSECHIMIFSWTRGNYGPSPWFYRNLF